MVDRLRVVSDAEQNLRINPNNAAIAGVDTRAQPGGHGRGCRLHQQRRRHRLRRVLYDIDAATDQLLRQGTRRTAATLTAVGPLGVNTSIDVAFDISPLDNTAFAALNVGGVAGLYTINLVTGAATPIGTIGTGTAINGLTAMPLVYQFAEGATGTFFDTDLLLANPTASHGRR